MDWYRVVKTIRGRRYHYWQKTYREGGKVKTLNKYIGPAGSSPAVIAAPLTPQGGPTDANPEMLNLFNTPIALIREIRDPLTNDEYSDDDELAEMLCQEFGLQPAEAAWWTKQRTWYRLNIVMDDGGIFDPKSASVTNPETGEVTQAPFGHGRS